MCDREDCTGRCIACSVAVESLPRWREEGDRDYTMGKPGLYLDIVQPTGSEFDVPMAWSVGTDLHNDTY